MKAESHINGVSADRLDFINRTLSRARKKKSELMHVSSGELADVLLDYHRLVRVENGDPYHRLVALNQILALRIPYGREPLGEIDWDKSPMCVAVPGTLHEPGCQWEICRRCKKPMYTCDCIKRYALEAVAYEVK